MMVMVEAYANLVMMRWRDRVLTELQLQPTDERKP